MNTYELPLPEQFDVEKDDAGHLHEWLVSQGIEVDGVSIVNAPLNTETTNKHVIVVAASDPTAALAAYVRTPLPNEVLRQQLEGIDIPTADLNELKQAVILMKELMQVKTDSTE